MFQSSFHTLVGLLPTAWIDIHAYSIHHIALCPVSMCVFALLPDLSTIANNCNSTVSCIIQNQSILLFLLMTILYETHSLLLLMLTRCMTVMPITTRVVVFHKELFSQNSPLTKPSKHCQDTFKQQKLLLCLTSPRSRCWKAASQSNYLSELTRACSFLTNCLMTASKLPMFGCCAIFCCLLVNACALGNSSSWFWVIVYWCWLEDNYWCHCDC